MAKNIIKTGYESPIDSEVESFIYNQIDSAKLFDKLNSKNNEFGNPFCDDFLTLSKCAQRFKLINTWYEIGEDYSVFPNCVVDRTMFYHLVKRARKSTKLTKELIKFGNEITVNGTTNLNLSFLFMRYVYLESIGFKGANATINDFEDLIKKEKLSTLYDLVMCLFKTQRMYLNGVEVKSKRELLKKKLKVKSLIMYDTEPLFNNFVLLMECALNILTEKEINTLKVSFGIYDSYYLEENDYYHNSDDTIRIIRNFKKKSRADAVNGVRKFVRANNEKFNEFSENGYSALYFVLVEYGEWLWTTMN